MFIKGKRKRVDNRVRLYAPPTAWLLGGVRDSCSSGGPRAEVLVTHDQRAQGAPETTTAAVPDGEQERLGRAHHIRRFAHPSAPLSPPLTTEPLFDLSRRFEPAAGHDAERE